MIEKLKWLAFNIITEEGEESWLLRSERIADALLAALEDAPTK